MTSRMTRLGLALALSAPLTLADFRYDQSSRMTGGAMMGMMQMAARFSKNAMQPVNSTIAVKGNRMVMNHGKTATIYDLDKETITEVNFEKKEVSVTTFAEMKAFMERAAKPAASGASYEVDVKETGKTEVVNGMKAREFLMTMKVTMNNPQTGKAGEMRMEISNWLGDALPGYQEIGEFHKRMAQKMDLAAAFGGAAAAQGGMGPGMAAAAKKLADMKGIPVVQVMRTMPTDPEQLKQMEESQKQMSQAQAQAQQGPPPSAGDAAGQAAAGAVAGRLGRLGGLGSTGLGGLGGLRRKKQQQEEAPAPAATAPAAAPAPAAAATSTAPVKGTFSSEASLMEMTIESKNYSNSGVEASMFEVPAGFKTVKGAMQR